MEIFVWVVVAGGLIVIFVVLPAIRRFRRLERWEEHLSHADRAGTAGRPPDDDDDSLSDLFREDSHDARRRRKEPHITSLWMPTIVSLIVLIACFTMILLPGTYGEDSAKFAFGAIGSVIGHWLSKAG